ncbi:MAG: heavy-metal-associated domain-containing protein [Gemmatimonadales bacterium]
MLHKKTLALPVAMLAGAGALPAAAHAQTPHDPNLTASAVSSILAGTDVVLRVDGMSCPFCAFALEHKLSEIAAVDSVVVRLSEGIIAIRQAAGTQIDDHELRAVVTKAGFSLREIFRPQN